MIGQQLAAVVPQVAFGRLTAVLPGASTLQVEGSFNEDWLRVLRIHRVLDESGAVLFDAAESHDRRAVEEAIDEVNTEYLDLLMDLTGDAYMGSHEITTDRA
ncbi:MAG: hypothetical protein M5U14_05120 [Acidimicrobiia bacterium]|nr:hypothetical protein [Acidimicrobiia bacterium]